MNFTVIIIVLLICIIPTIFLVIKSYSSTIWKIFIILISVIMGAFLIFLPYIFDSKIEIKETKTLEEKETKIGKTTKSVEIQKLQPNPLLNIEPIQTFITFDSIKSYVISKNFKDTEIENSGTKLIFHNHPKYINKKNKLNFSFSLEKDYNYFSACIKIKDNTKIKKKQPTYIKITADNEVVFSQKLYSTSLPLYIDLDISEISDLSFSISTKMINTKEKLFRTISFSDIHFE